MYLTLNGTLCTLPSIKVSNSATFLLNTRKLSKPNGPKCEDLGEQ